MLLWIVLAVVGWCLVPLPLAVLAGRALRAAGHGKGRRGPGGRGTYELAA